MSDNPLWEICERVAELQARMRETCTSGSVRGALSNERPLYVADYLANKHIC